MNRNTRTIIVLAVAVLTAGLATVLMYFLFKPGPPPPKLFVAVAKKNLQMGSMVAEADVKMVAWPRESLIPGAETSTDKVKDHVLLADVLENEPITESKISKDGVGLTPKILDGYRALSVKVNEVIGVAGFVTPGTHVDVVVTIRRNQSAKSRIVVSDVVVLTAGAKYDDPDARKQGKPIPSTVVTLMVKPADAERIAVASTQGQIMLALRGPLDKEIVPTAGITDAQIMDWLDAPTRTPTTPVPPRTGSGGNGSPKVIDAGPKNVRPATCFETFKGGKHEEFPCV